MIEIVKFEPRHWYEIQEQEATNHLRSYFTPEDVERMADTPLSYAALSEGRVVACGGVFEYWEGRGAAWFEFARVCRKEFLQIHRATKRFLEVCPLKRIEVTVDCKFQEAHRWAKLLGFELEAPRMRNYSPDGQDYALYARVK